jgi:D-alanyl-D-alanine carboxypeptidase
MLSNMIRSGFAKTAAIAAAGLIALTAMVVQSDVAEAKRRAHGVSSSKATYAKRIKAKKVHTARRTRVLAPEDGRGNPLYADIVMDVKSGRVLHEASADALRHPASITKVMTLYMLFEQLDAGRLTLASQLPVSEHAAAQAPTKLGLRPGQTISVQDAISGMVTRSANDAAVVVAEAIGGSEDNFAALMTRRARSLGMTRTVYRNASGLPDAGQITTARDLAVLGVAIQDRFPRYYRFFQTRSFVYRGRGISNHNRLLGSVEGVDGIKTGYTRMSGFNLLTSVKRADRQLVAVIMGGRSSGSRDAAMRRLIDRYMPVAYAGNRQTGTLVASAAARPAAKPATRPAAIPDPDPGTRDAVAFAQAQEQARQPQPAPAAIRPAVVAETPKPKANAPVAPQAKLAALVQPAPAAPPPQPQVANDALPAVASTDEAQPILRWVEGPAPVTAPASAPARTADSSGRVPGDGSPVQFVRTTTFRIDDQSQGDAPSSDTGSLAQQPAKVHPTAEAAQSATEPERSGWIIQIGATDSESAARKLLDKARSTGHRLLASAEPFTESVERNGSTLWRARFAGFNDQRQAQAACAALKSKDFACMAARL